MNRRLNATQVRLIRKLWRPNEVGVHGENGTGFGIRNLAERFGVSPYTIDAIVKRRTWKHL
jgi:DNA-binding MarR family transcriptional regulator